MQSTEEWHRWRRVALSASVFVCWLGLSTAAAQPSGDDPTFDQLVERAKASFGEESYDEAVDQMRRAWAKESHPRLLFNIARSFDKKGDCERALVYYQSFLNQDDISSGLEKRAKGALRDADSCDAYTAEHAGRLVLRSSPSGAKVTVDGESVGTTPTEVAGLEAGEHELEFEASGYRSRAVTERLQRATDAEVAVELEEAPQTSDDSSGESSEKNETEEGEGSSDGGFEPRTGPVAVAGAGVALGIVGAVFDLVTLPNIDDRRRRVSRNRGAYDDPGARLDELKGRRRVNRNLALTGYIGAAALVTGGVLWQFVFPPGETEGSDETAELRLAPWSGEHVAGGLRIDLRF